MFNLCRLCTAPLCRHKTLSFPEDPAQDIAPTSSRSLPSPVFPAPCLLSAKLPLASTESQCSHPCPGRYRWQLQSPAQSRPGQQSATLQVCREEKAHSAERQPGCRLGHTWTLLLWRTRLQCWEPEHFSPNTSPATAHSRARSSARQAGQTQHQAYAGTHQCCSPHAHSSLSSQQLSSAGRCCSGLPPDPFYCHLPRPSAAPCVLDLLTLLYAASTFPSRRSTKSPTWPTAGLAEAPGKAAKPPWEARVPRVSGIL